MPPHNRTVASGSGLRQNPGACRGIHTGGKNRNRVCRDSVGGVRWESLHCIEIFPGSDSSFLIEAFP